MNIEDFPAGTLVRSRRRDSLWRVSRGVTANFKYPQDALECVRVVDGVLVREFAVLPVAQVDKVSA